MAMESVASAIVIPRSRRAVTFITWVDVLALLTALSRTGRGKLSIQLLRRFTALPARVRLRRVPKRFQVKRTKGWKMPADGVYVGRRTKWGNPFKISAATSR